MGIQINYTEFLKLAFSNIKYPSTMQSVGMQTKLKASVENQRYHMILIKLSMQIKFNALLVHLYNPSKKTQYILTGKS